MGITFHVPPGWPPSPEGWLPPHDWSPPAHWPAAPEGWAYYRGEYGEPVAAPPTAWRPPGKAHISAEGGGLEAIHRPLATANGSADPPRGAFETALKSSLLPFGLLVAVAVLFELFGEPEYFGVSFIISAGLVVWASQRTLGRLHPQTDDRDRRSTVVGLVLSGLLLFLAAASVAQGARSEPEFRLVEARDACGVGLHTSTDGGRSITLDVKGEDDERGEAVTSVACILMHLQAPNHVIAHIDSTRALDGQQTAEWDDLAARWTYHPSAGLTLTIVDKRIR